jgi:pyruvate dehydrogenase E1 component alpha subunit
VSLRIHGHGAHDDARYVPQELRDEYARLDPIDRLAARLALDGVPLEELEALVTSVTSEIAAGLAEAEASPAPDPATLEDGVWARPV